MFLQHYQFYHNLLNIKLHHLYLIINNYKSLKIVILFIYYSPYLLNYVYHHISLHYMLMI